MNRPAPFPSTSNSSYDVFISFRGEDTRYGFVGNLYHALVQKRIRTFIDDEEIQKGDEITQVVYKAIEESKIVIIVFSKNFASSTFCLNELVKISECIEGKGRLVWPIFYDVEPSEIRYQKGNYAKALARHKKNLKPPEVIQSWKIALHKTANLKGLYINPGTKYEYKIIEQIVEEVSDKMKCQNEIFASNSECLKWDPMEFDLICTVKCQNEIFASNKECLKWDPMECEYKVTCHEDSPDRRRDLWLGMCFNLFNFIASLCPSS